MKTNYFFIFLLFTLIAQAQIVSIPDGNFKNALLNSNCADLDGIYAGTGDFESNVDTNGDGEIQVSEAEAVNKLLLNNLNIISLEGIQSFTNITDLRCENNQLASLDLSLNTKLELVLCNDNLLTSLDVSQCPNLNRLHCNKNQLEDIDVSSNSIIYALDCTYNNLTSLNVKNGNNQNIFQMWAYNNINLTCINVDNVSNSNSKGNWFKNNTVIYSENCSTLGLEDYENIDFSMFPNPVQNILTIQSRQGQVESIKIISLNGLFLKEILGSKIDISDFSSGLYFVRVNINGYSITRKFIKF